MADAVLKVPGVYLREQVERASPVLSTGVPAFIGFVSDHSSLPDRTPVVLRRKSALPPDPGFPKVKDEADVRLYLERAVTGFFDNGGGYCYVVGLHVNPRDSRAAASLINVALDALAPLSDVDLVAMPDAVDLRLKDVNGKLTEETDVARVLQVQAAMIRHCARLNRVALLDALRGRGAQDLIDQQVSALGVADADAANAALYHPWVRTVATGDEFVPPSGHVAGIIARTDAAVGPFKAPANAEIQGAIDLNIDLDAEALGQLNDAGVNSLRAFSARGIRVWGARTLSRNREWRFLNVRRLVLTVLRWIDLNMTWAAFEPNVPALWARIQRELSAYLIQLWRAGALQGTTLAEAFYIRVDAQLNPAASREEGRVITEIGLAPTSPAEFIVVSVEHRAGTTELI